MRVPNAAGVHAAKVQEPDTFLSEHIQGPTELETTAYLGFGRRP